MDDLMHLKLKLKSIDGTISKEVTFEDCESWTTLMLAFADFLSSQYGYCISDKMLFVTDHPWARERDYAISTDELNIILEHRNKQQELFGDDE
jgi:hypothetical protein